ncbi:MAG TPA: ribonuclease Y [Candidatus Paceibacterota bacterium]|nr:ribonuclease Y [Candidatus Paceibacterota bacterium]
MITTLLLTYLVCAGILGVLLGYFLRVLIAMSRKGSAELRIKEILLNAREEAKRIVEEAKEEADELTAEQLKEIKDRDEKSRSLEERLIKKDEQLEKRQAEFEREVISLKDKVAEINILKENADVLLKERTEVLEKTAGFSAEEAKNELLKETEIKNEEDLLVRMQKLEHASEEKLECRAKTILTSAIQRLATSVYSDVMSTSVAIPSEEMKGKIIGKEGRNIKAFERITGVEVIVDDTPNAITISSFNPLRRQAAKTALDMLIADGRIQPAKIEELYTKAKEEVNKAIKERGEQAVYECGVFNLDPRLTSIIGRLHFRTSYGQNVLQHSIEVAHIAGMIAQEVGANVHIAKAGGLLHDIGKALDHEVQGTHVEIGRRILQKFGVSEEIIKAMQAHHGEYPYETLESIIVQTADAISGSRPGARKDSVEIYLQRLEDLENIANKIPGVEKSYVLSAGREIRVFIKPEEISDIESKRVAREIAVAIENELKYPGEIKVTVIRETRVTEFAR